MAKMRYTYEDFIKDLKIGHEFDFCCKNEKYAIAEASEGWYIIKVGEDDCRCYKDISNFIANLSIDSKHISTIWDDITFNMIY